MQCQTLIYVRAKGLNSDPHAHGASTLPTEPSPRAFSNGYPGAAQLIYVFIIIQ